MAAVVSIKELNGVAPGTANPITNARYCTRDSYAPGAASPIVKPNSGVRRSYWKSHYLNADTTPAGTINNVRWFTDGLASWTGTTLYAGTTPTYAQATGTQGVEGDDSAVATVDAATYTAAAPLSVPGSLSNPNTGKISDLVVTQLDVASNAVGGTQAQRTITWRYDET